MTMGAVVRKKTVSRLLQDGDVKLKLIASALNDVAERKLSPEEAEWVHRIESIRKSLMRVREKISITDYGAGTQSLGVVTATKGRIVERTIGDVCRNSSESFRWVFLLFKLIRKSQPLVCLELGTAVGISGSYLAAALELNLRGKLVTLEGADALAALASENFLKLGLKKTEIVVGRFQDTLRPTAVKNEPIDFVFFDGHHEEEATLAYYEQVLPSLSNEAILVFDDVSWSKGMARAWKTIQNHEHVRIAVDLFDLGICVFSKLPVEKKNRRIVLL